VDAADGDRGMGAGVAEEIGGGASDDESAGARVRTVARGSVGLVGGVPELEGGLAGGQLGQVFEPGLEFRRERGGRSYGTGLVDEAEHHSDAVLPAGLKEAEDVAIEEIRVGFPGAVGHKDAYLIEVEAPRVVEVVFHLRGVVLQPQSSVPMGPDRRVERGGVVEAADVGEIGRGRLGERREGGDGESEDEGKLHWQIPEREAFQEGSVRRGVATRIGGRQER